MANPADDSDRALLARLKLGRDAAALAELVRRYGGLVHGVCRRRLGPDVAGQAALAVFRELMDHPGKVGGALPVWLHGAALARGDGGPGMAPADAEPGWASLAPALDTALAALPPLPRWHLLTAWCALPPRGHAEAYAREVDEALARPIHDAVRLLADRLGAAAPEPRELAGLLDRNAIELPPPALAAELGRLALGALPEREVETVTPGMKRAKLVWSIAIGGMIFVLLMAVVFWAISEWTARNRKADAALTPQPDVESR